GEVGGHVLQQGRGDVVVAEVAVGGGDETVDGGADEVAELAHTGLSDGTDRWDDASRRPRSHDPTRWATRLSRHRPGGDAPPGRSAAGPVNTGLPSPGGDADPVGDTE